MLATARSEALFQCAGADPRLEEALAVGQELPQTVNTDQDVGEEVHKKPMPTRPSRSVTLIVDLSGSATEGRFFGGRSFAMITGDPSPYQIMRPPMPNRLFVTTLAFGVALAFNAAAGPLEQSGTTSRTSETLEVNGVDQRQTLPCDGRQVVIAGSGNVIELTGTCAGLDLAGVDNRVEINLAPDAHVTVAGAGNQLRWSSTGRPRIRVEGVANEVTRLN